MTNNVIIKKFSNYNEYSLAGWQGAAKKVDEQRLVAIIDHCRRMIKNPYIRFMLVSDVEEAHCVVYNDTNHVTKLIPLSEVEKMIMEGKFHK